MKQILMLGTGLSTNSLIKYLLKHAEQEDWYITLGDLNVEQTRKKLNGSTRAEAVKFDICNLTEHLTLFQKSDIIISMLPARFHQLVAEACLQYSKNMVTASYVSEEMKELDQQARQRNLLFLNELGVDPGIDHMSALKVIHRIMNQGGKLSAFRSHTGGLVAPEFDNNPWNYKFTWNPRNVVLAGQGNSMLIRNGKYKYIPYHKLFKRYDHVSIQDMGEFEVYPNRDSLKYRETYGLQNIPTMIRGTLRRPGFCDAWDVLVQLGITDDSYNIEDSAHMTYRDFINSYLKYDTKVPVEEKIANYLGLDPNGIIMNKIKWLGLFEDEAVGLENASPASILQKKLEEKLCLDPTDKDMIIMEHAFEYNLNGKHWETRSSLVVKGIDQNETAMAMTVGIPVGIATRLVLNGTITKKGVLIPILSEIYEPILLELQSHGINFVEQTNEIIG